jgi:hypothetical protein
MDFCSICADRYTEIQVQLVRDIADAQRELTRKQADEIEKRMRWDQESARLAGDITRGCFFTP